MLTFGMEKETRGHFFAEAAELQGDIRIYLDTYKTFEDLLKNKGRVEPNIRGVVPLPKDEISTIETVNLTVEVNPLADTVDSGLLVVFSIQIGPNNFQKLREISLPNPQCVSIDNIKETNQNLNLKEVVDRIKKYSEVRESFIPTFN